MVVPIRILVAPEPPMPTSQRTVSVASHNNIRSSSILELPRNPRRIDLITPVSKVSKRVVMDLTSAYSQTLSSRFCLSAAACGCVIIVGIILLILDAFTPLLK